MRDPIENVSLLQKQLNTLQLENQILKNIIDRSGLSYMQELKHLREPEGTENFEPNQGARIIHPRIYFSLISGVVLMFTQSGRKRKMANPDIIPSVITSGLKYVQENLDRR